jgi:hypothetical protein
VGHREFVGQAEKALGVADEKKALRIEAPPELVDEPLLLGFVK